MNSLKNDFNLAIIFSICFCHKFSFCNSYKKKTLKIFIFAFIFGTLSGVWFVEPGNLNLAPIISILFLENTILSSNGVLRLIRPMAGFILLSFLTYFSMILIKKFLFKN
ncbi:MAG: hypothetical protein CMG07_03340 [Candidatus Marinimicrobia bacterium]|nr:hypothetical protein [Candidatus Neomarinimicrobiota bacterium]